MPARTGTSAPGLPAGIEGAIHAARDRWDLISDEVPDTGEVRAEAKIDLRARTLEFKAVATMDPATNLVEINPISPRQQKKCLLPSKTIV